jgi:UDP-GlcNAc:undecaprenyl-phosphate GlcNAc-1-phosphate transferase
MPVNPLDWTFHYAASFLAALVATLLITRFFRDHVAARVGLLDDSESAREREWPVAKVGGIAMCAAISIVAVAATYLSPLPLLNPEETRSLVPVLFGALAMCAVGLWDDVRDLSPGRKLAFQALVAVAVWYAGARFGSFRLPAVGVVELSGFASLVFTVLWFLAITNAFNLVDGADGVAGGAALTATLAMFVVALVLGQPMAAQVLVVLAAALLGFLFFNFPPATVFMGDSGSLSIGFLLAGVGLVSSSKATTIAAIAIPVVSLGLPILDTGLAIIRRLLRGEGVHKRDLGHIHHRLQKLGHSPRDVALILYAACGTLALASMVFLSPDLKAIGLVLLVVGVATLLAVQRLRVPELMELRRVMDRALRQREVIARSVALREAVGAIEQETTLDGIVRQIGLALRATQCDRAEFRLRADMVAGLDPERAKGRDASGSEEFVWTWDYSEVASIHPRGEVAWEVAVPVTLPEAPDPVGRLVVTRPPIGLNPDDLGLIVDSLQGELSRAAARLGAIRESALDRDAGAA